MPYQPNSPRWEFTATDRTTMQTQANAALTGLMSLNIEPIVDQNYIKQIVGRSTVQRGSFDAMCTALLAMTPTFNYVGPFPDTR